MPRLIVCGCLPQRYREDVAAELPEVDLFLGSSEYGRIAEHIRALSHAPCIRTASDHRQTVHFCNPRTRPARFQRPARPPTSRSPRAVRTAAPTARFRPSRARFASARAAPLCRRPAHSPRRHSGDKPGRTGHDPLQRPSRAAARAVPRARPEWIRLLYCHPAHLHTEIIRMMASEPKLCRYIDIPLQHIADPVLKRMGRRESTQPHRSPDNRARASAPRSPCAPFLPHRRIPRRNRQRFQELLDFVRDVRFDNLRCVLLPRRRRHPCREDAGRGPRARQARRATMSS